MYATVLSTAPSCSMNQAVFYSRYNRFLAVESKMLRSRISMLETVLSAIGREPCGGDPRHGAFHDIFVEQLKYLKKINSDLDKEMVKAMVVDEYNLKTHITERVLPSKIEKVRSELLKETEKAEYCAKQVAKTGISIVK